MKAAFFGGCKFEEAPTRRARTTNNNDVVPCDFWSRHFVSLTGVPSHCQIPAVFYGNGVIHGYVSAYMCLPFSKITTRFRVPGTIVGWFLFYRLMVWSAPRLAKKIVLNGTSSFTTLGHWRGSRDF